MNKIKGSIPNLLTFLNLSLGIIAILISVNSLNDSSSLMISSFLILIAAFADRFDGKVARMFGTATELGKELDSMSDLISFGVAPIIISWKLSLISYGIAGYLIVLLFPIAGAYRLARYNLTTFDNVYTGVPITFAGAFLSLINLLNYSALKNNNYSYFNSYTIAFFVILFSFLMVSKLKFKKF